MATGEQAVGNQVGTKPGFWLAFKQRMSRRWAWPRASWQLFKQKISRQRAYLRKSGQAFNSLQKDYHLFTILLAVLLVASCLVGIAGTYDQGGVLAAWRAQFDWSRMEKAFGSDAFRGLLASIIALLIGISIKRRQASGVLDGDDEHYSIGRALAFGYFKNFLVGALQVAKANGQALHVFNPKNVEDLRTFEHKIWPQARSQFTTVAREIDPALTATRKPLVRRVIAMQISGAAGQREFWLDFPTTLFTIADYYESWNNWLISQNRPNIEPEELLAFEQLQIGAFFGHLNLLMTSDIGHKAVKDHGLEPADMADLLKSHYKLVGLTDLRDLLFATSSSAGT